MQIKHYGWLSMRTTCLTVLPVALCLFATTVRNATAESRSQDAAAQSAEAQNHEPPAILEIVVESVKEGRSAAHQKVESDWAAAFRRHNMPHQLTLTSMTGANEAWFLIGFPSFAAVEENDRVFQKPAVKADMDMMDARDGELRVNTRTMYAVYRKDMSYRPDLVNIGKTRYVGIETYRPKLGRMHDFEEGGKKFLAAYEKADLKTPAVAYEVIAGGPSGDMVLFLEPMETLKTLDEFPAREKAVRDAMGDDYDKMMAGAGDVFTSIQYSLFAVNPRMSYMSKETEDADPAFWRPKPSAKAATPPKQEKAGQ
jgi:hypothetical protein